jgi:S-adenosylmethionine-diacylgycerolhomoserine-N-methlytransferase
MRQIAADLGILLRMLRGQPRTGTHAQRLEAFYRPQAARYDVFRERLLQGRNELLSILTPAAGSRIVELGAGTGRNLEFFGERIQQFARVEIVDICPALLEQARSRCRDWPNVRVIAGDAVNWTPDAPVDCVYFSYALTMIPDWRAAIDNALAMLKPGGTLAVVDFHVLGTGQRDERTSHGAFTRWFWPRWFRHDGVYLGPERFKLRA